MKVRGDRRSKRKAERHRVKQLLHMDPRATVPKKEEFKSRIKGNEDRMNKPIK
jgi:hypothetical protein